MSKEEKFLKTIKKGYTFKGDSIILGGAMLEGVTIPENFVRIPLKTLNRHGLIAGATGTGKTKSLQVLAEQLSGKGVPSLIMDIKGDLSGIAVASDGHKKIDERHEQIGLPFIAGDSPVEFLSLSDEKGTRLRATVSEFGPILLGKILNLNATQSGILSVLFKYCDDNRYALLDLKDLKKALQYIQDVGKAEFQAEYGKVSSVSAGTIMRKIVELEQQDADLFFGERSFDVEDLCRQDDDGRGIINILRVTDMQTKPKLFSTFMLQMLAEIYTRFSEQGDSDKPKLCLFIDEAHLVFDKATDALLEQILQICKLIRSKGVGIFFITQNPIDIPDGVLAQLGLKIQHALRAFTAKDRKAIRLAVQNYPDTDFYKMDKLITEMGIGEAMISVLNEKGIPTPLVHTMMRAPQSRMDTLSDREINKIVKQSDMAPIYNQEIDRESAYEILTGKIEEAMSSGHQKILKKQRRRAEKSTMEKVLNSTTTRQVGRTIARELTRGLLGAFGIKTGRRSSRRSWF